MKRRARIKTGLFLIGSLHFRSFTSREQTIQLWLRSSVGEGVGSGGGGGGGGFCRGFNSKLWRVSDLVVVTSLPRELH